MFPSDFYKRRLKVIASIVSRNVFLLTNGIILVVVVLLTVFGDVQEGMFLALVTLLNIVLGFIQEISAWLTLEKLQLLTAPRMTRINQDGTETTVMTEEIKKGDKIKIKTGDQI